MRSFTASAIPGIPMINTGDDVGGILAKAICHNHFELKEGDIVVVAQKIVSKAEGAIIKLNDINPSEEAMSLAHQTGRDPRHCQVIINESAEILQVKGRMIITRHRLGFVNSNALVDRSNIASADKETVVLIPKDPDSSAMKIRTILHEWFKIKVAVIINDSLGREDREGSVGMAIGIAGISHLEYRRQQDLFGRDANSQIALIDELAAVASILMGQANEGCPVVVIRGVDYTIDESASIHRILNQ